MLRKLLPFTFAVALLCAPLLSASTAHAQQSPQMQQAVAQAQQTGRPILALAMRENCGNCQALKRTIEGDAELQAIMQEYIVLPIDVDNNAEWGPWAQQFAPQANTLPFVYIVSAAGQEMAQLNGGRAGQQLKPLLVQNYQLAVQQSRQLTEAKEAEERAAQAAARREEAEAAREARRQAALAEAAEDEVDRPATTEDSPAREDASADEEQELTSAQLTRRLDGWLRMANTFAETRPEKSREYVQRILDLAPESDQASAARTLLETLD